MSLQDKLDALKTDFETQAPPAAIAVFHKATAELVASGLAQRALKSGDRAPSFKLPNADGIVVDSAELLARGPVVLTFYRGVWCPYCNLELQAIEAAAERIRAHGASLLAISQQTRVNSRKSQEQNHLSFPILSDHGGVLSAAFGLRFRLPDDLIEVYRGFGVDLPVINGEASWTLPMPGRFVIAQDGVIVYAEVNPDYTRRPDPAELLPALAGLRTIAA